MFFKVIWSMFLKAMKAVVEYGYLQARSLLLDSAVVRKLQNDFATHWASEEIERQDLQPPHQPRSIEDPMQSGWHLGGQYLKGVGRAFSS